MLLEMTIGRDNYSYWLRPIPADYGQAFELRKSIAEGGDVYHVCLDGQRSHRKETAMSKPITTAPAAAVLQQQLAAAGYQHGAPEHVSKETLAIDGRLAGRLRCPGCNRRGMTFKAFHRGRQYAGLACCRHCPAGVEV
jgi:hypothetical protein